MAKIAKMAKMAKYFGQGQNGKDRQNGQDSPWPLIAKMAKIAKIAKMAKYFGQGQSFRPWWARVAPSSQGGGPLAIRGIFLMVHQEAKKIDAWI